MDSVINAFSCGICKLDPDFPNVFIVNVDCYMLLMHVLLVHKIIGK